MRSISLPVATSYDIPIDPSDKESTTLIDMLPSPGPSAEEVLIQQDLAQKTLAKLNDRERQVILGRASGMTLDQLGMQFGLSRERIRQIEMDAHAVANNLPRVFGGPSAALVPPAVARDPYRESKQDMSRRECLWCRVMFSPRRRNNVFCGDQCSDRFHRRKYWLRKKEARDLYQSTIGRKGA